MKDKNQLALERKHREQFPACAICKQCGTVIHHMIRGVNRRYVIYVPAAWLHLCDACHDMVHNNVAEWPLAKQLAVKLCSEPESFDLERCNNVTPVSIVEVASYTVWRF